MLGSLLHRQAFVWTVSFIVDKYVPHFSFRLWYPRDIPMCSLVLLSILVSSDTFLLQQEHLTVGVNMGALYLSVYVAVA